jgi:hypothetical protein
MAIWYGAPLDSWLSGELKKAKSLLAQRISRKREAKKRKAAA